jgi:hypothetical protein
MGLAATSEGFGAVRPLPGRRRRSVSRRLRARIESFLGTVDLSYERNFLFVRPVIALLVTVAVYLADDLPGRDGVVAACLAAVIYNVLVGFLVVKRRIFLLRITTLLLDNLTVIVASLHVFHAMGSVGYESDLWLIYMILIVTNALYYGPVGSLLFTTLWTGLLVGMTLGFYDAGSYSRSELPVRLTFFVLTGFCAISLSAELRKRREKLERQSRQTLSMLAQIVEARDSDAGKHLRRITHYSRALALSLGYDDEAADEIAYAAMIHDVGKAQVPDAILKKPGPLTPDERREIEKHTVWGHELLADNEEFKTAAHVARWHHERWDGGGYPDRLHGAAIPIAARIAAVADVYDALISERPYKRAWPRTDAIAEIRRLRGTHLDPAVVDAMLELYASGTLDRLDREPEHDAHAGHRLAA